MNRYRRSAAQKTGVEPTVLNTDDSIYFVSSSESSPKKPNIISRKSNVLKRPPAPISNSSLSTSQEQVVIFQQQQRQLAPNSHLEASMQPSQQQVLLPSATTGQMEMVQNGHPYKSQVYYLLDDGTLAVVDNSSLLPPVVDESSSIVVHQSQVGGQQLYPGQLLQLDQTQQQHRLILPQLQPQHSFVVQQHPVHMQQLSMRVQPQVPIIRQRPVLKSKFQQHQKQQEFQLKQELERQRKQKQLEAIVKLKLETDEQQRLQQQRLREHLEMEERQRLHQEQLKAGRELEEQQRIRDEQAAENLHQLELNMELNQYQKQQSNDSILNSHLQLDEIKQDGILVNEEQQEIQQENIFDSEKQHALGLETQQSLPIFDSAKVDEEEGMLTSQQLQDQDEECQQDQYVILQMGNKTLLLPVATFQEYCEAQQSDDVEKTTRFLAMIEQALGEANESSESQAESSETFLPSQDSTTNMSNDCESIQMGDSLLHERTSSPVSNPSSDSSTNHIVQGYQLTNGQHILEQQSPDAELNLTPVRGNNAIQESVKTCEAAESSLVLSPSVLSMHDDDRETQVINCENTEEGEYDYEQPPTKRLKEGGEEVSKVTQSNSPVAAQIKSQTEASTKKDNIKIFRCGTCTKEFLTQDLCMQHLFDVHKADPLKTHCDYRRTKETRYMCHNCARTFGSFAEFDQHNVETHLSDTNGNNSDSDRSGSETQEKRASTPSSSSAVSPSSFQSANKTTSSPITTPGIFPATFTYTSSTNLKSETHCSQSSKNTEILAYPTSLNCSKCSKTLANLYYFLLHGLVHMSESNIDNNHWLCQICRETFSSKPELTSHFLIHYQMSMGASASSNNISYNSTQGNVTEYGSSLTHDPSPEHPSTLNNPHQTEHNTQSIVTSPADQPELQSVRNKNDEDGNSEQGISVKKFESSTIKDTQIWESVNDSTAVDIVLANKIIGVTCDTSVAAELKKEDLNTIISMELGENSSEHAPSDATEAERNVHPVCHSVPSEMNTKHEEPSDGDQKTVTVDKIGDKDSMIGFANTSASQAPEEVCCKLVKGGQGEDEDDLKIKNMTEERNVKYEIIPPAQSSEKSNEDLPSSSYVSKNTVSVDLDIKAELISEPLRDHKDIECESKAENDSTKEASKKRNLCVPRIKKKSDLHQLPRRRTRLSAKEVPNEEASNETKTVTVNGVVDLVGSSKTSSCNNLPLIRTISTRRGSKTNTISVIPHDNLMDPAPDFNGRLADKNTKVKVVEGSNQGKAETNEIIKRPRGRPKKKQVEKEPEGMKLMHDRVSRGGKGSVSHPDSERKTRNSLKLVNGNKSASISKESSEIQETLPPDPLPEKKLVETRSSRSKRKVSSVDMKKSLRLDSDPVPPAKTKITKAIKNSNITDPKVVHGAAANVVEKSTDKKLKRGRKSQTVSRNFAGDEPEFEAGPSKLLRNGSSTSPAIARRKDRGSFCKGMNVDDLSNPLSRTVVQETFMNIYKKMKESAN